MTVGEIKSKYINYNYKIDTTKKREKKKRKEKINFQREYYQQVEFAFIKDSLVFTMSSTSHFAPTVTFTLLNPTDARDELRTSYSTLNRREIRIAQRDLARMREAEVSSGVEPNQNTAAGENHITSFSSSSSREEVAENGPNPPHYPGPRSGHSVLYSSFLKASVLYAGMDYDESHADVWLLRVRRKIDDTPTVAEAVHRSDRAGEDDEEDAEHTHNNEKKGERQSSVSASLAAEENKYRAWLLKLGLA